MGMPSVEGQIFKEGSTTYFVSSKLFPKRLREDVYRLYSFVRIADNYVDKRPPQPKKLAELAQKFKAALADPNFESIAHAWDSTEERVVKNMVNLSHKYKFKPEWVTDFLAAMQQDVQPKAYKSLDDSLAYVHGSAEVIGLMMARMMRVDGKTSIARTLRAADLKTQRQKAQGLKHKTQTTLKQTLVRLQKPEERYREEAEQHIEKVRTAAAMQGRAMQWINFVRDIAEDNTLGRCYFPQADLAKFKLKDLSKTTIQAQPEDFKKFVDLQLQRYQDWQQQAEQGYRYIPRRLRLPLRTAADMYNWTAQQIAKNPLAVYERKIKPSKRQVAKQAARHRLHRK